MRRILGFRSFVRTVKFDFCKVESEPSFASDTMDKSLNSLDQEQIQTNANEYKYFIENFYLKDWECII